MRQTQDRRPSRGHPGRGSALPHGGLACLKTGGTPTGRSRRSGRRTQARFLGPAAPGGGAPHDTCSCVCTSSCDFLGSHWDLLLLDAERLRRSDYVARRQQTARSSPTRVRGVRGVRGRVPSTGRGRVAASGRAAGVGPVRTEASRSGGPLSRQADVPEPSGPMPQGRHRADPLLSSRCLRCSAEDKADVQLTDLGGDAQERTRGCEAGKAGSPGGDLRGRQGRASALHAAGLPWGCSEGASEPSTVDVAGRRLHLHGSRFQQRPRRGAPANTRDRAPEGGRAGPSGSATRGHQGARVKACVEDAAMRHALRDRARGGVDVTDTRRGRDRATPLALTAGGCTPEPPGDAGSLG